MRDAAWIDPDKLGMILHRILPNKEVTLEHKLYFTELAHELGSQAIEELKNIAQFMSAVSEY